MKKILLLVVSVFILLINLNAQTTLNPGELVIVNVNSDTPDNFDFIPLVNLEAGTIIYFADNGWNGTALTTNEGTVTWTASTFVDKGTVMSYNGTTVGDWVKSSNFALNASGDNLLVYQGSATTPSFIYGVGWAKANNWTYTGSSDSEIPAPLSVITNTIIHLGTSDDYIYNGISTGTVSQLLASVANSSNWVGNDDASNPPYTPNFSIIASTNYTITFGVTGSNGTVTATVDGSPITSPASVESGKTVIFTATPDANYQVDDWTLDGTPLSNSSNTYTINSVSANATVNVAFEPASFYTITFGVTGSNGTIAATVDGNPITSPATIQSGKTVIFTATPDANYQVDDWTLDGTPLSITSNTYTINSVSANATVNVAFEMIPTYTITFGVTGSNGSIAATVDGNPITSPATVQTGKTVIFTATPDANYQVKDWTLNTTSLAISTSTYNYTVASSDAIIQVEFELIPIAPTTIVEWNFPNNPDDAIADGGITANLAKTITSMGAGVVLFTNAGATTQSAHTTAWDNGMDTKYWEIEFTTGGYKDLTLSSKQRSSGTGPKDFKAQYKIGTTGTWTDIATIIVENNFTAGVLNNVTLPNECNNQISLYVRWIMTSNISVNNAAVGSGGVNNIDDIIIKGIPFTSSDAEILSFDIPNQISSTVNSTAGTVTVVMPALTNPNGLIPAIAVSPGASISPNTGIAQDFSTSKTYIVTAADLTTKTWTVTVNVNPASTAAEIITFDIPTQISSTINSTNATVDVIMPTGTTLTSLVPTFTLSTGAVIAVGGNVQQSGISTQDFTNTVSYLVTAEDGSTTKPWTVTVSLQASNLAEILSFDVPNQVTNVINSTAATVLIDVPYGTTITSLSPVITISTGASVNPTSGSAQDFTNSVIYTVTAQNGTTTKPWTVTITVLPQPETTIVEWNFPNSPDDSIADGGITQNLTKGLITNSTGTVSYNLNARNSGWDNGMDTKYWEIEFTTGGYKDITLSSKQRSSNTGPKEFKAQYKLGVNGTWNDIQSIEVADNYTLGVLANVDLPSTCNNQHSLFVRWIMTSNVSVSNATVASGGASNIDDIIIKGKEYISGDAEIIAFDIPNQISSTINSTNATVFVVMPQGTDVTILSPTILPSIGASVSPNSGISQNFLNPVVYTVTAQDGNTTKNWEVTVTISSGINTNNNFNISVYPNPANDQLFVKFNEPFTLEIISIDGKQVLRTISDSNNLSLNISNLQKGIYVIQLKGHNSFAKQSLIIE